MGKSYKNYNLKKDIEGRTVKYDIEYPGVGATGESLQVRSMYSDEFRTADAKANRQISTMIQAVAGDMEKVDKDLMRQIQMESFATLVASWTFEEECTPENVADFLKDNPNVYDDVNRMAATDSLFFSKKESV